jgi:phosphate/sulfate permease
VKTSRAKQIKGISAVGAVLAFCWATDCLSKAQFHLATVAALVAAPFLAFAAARFVNGLLQSKPAGSHQSP